MFDYILEIDLDESLILDRKQADTVGKLISRIRQKEGRDISDLLMLNFYYPGKKEDQAR